LPEGRNFAAAAAHFTKEGFWEHNIYNILGIFPNFFKISVRPLVFKDRNVVGTCGFFRKLMEMNQEISSVLPKFPVLLKSGADGFEKSTCLTEFPAVAYKSLHILPP
jgi:hypothetical protein